MGFHTYTLSACRSSELLPALVLSNRFKSPSNVVKGLASKHESIRPPQGEHSDTDEQWNPVVCDLGVGTIMDILIIGAGFVGISTAVTFAEIGHKVTCLDTDSEKIQSLKTGKLPFYEPGLESVLNKHLQNANIQFCSHAKRAIEENSTLFICVGTPSTGSGDADLTYVRQVAKTIGEYMNGYKIVVNKSTAPVGTCMNLQKWIASSQCHPWPYDVVSNPEFLREGNALVDSLHPHRVIIGSNNEKAAGVISKLYEPMNCPIMVTNPHTAEFIKYASNSFLATKISYMNELARLCDVLQVNIRDVALGMGFDPRISNQFLEAGVGYGGSCFPKDVDALLAMADDYGATLSILKAAKQVNETQYLYLLSKLQRELGSLKGKIVAVFGISFKPNTSDIRESPALSIIEYLSYCGTNIRVHDPITTLPTWLQQTGIRQCDTPEEAANEADAILLCTDWPQYRSTVDWLRIKSKMRNRYVFDGRNMLDMEFMRSLGFSYQGIGYPY